jgi:hypothetical protein
MSGVPAGIDPLYVSTSRLIGLLDGEEHNHATAFFWRQNNQTFIVTNKHVILGEHFVTNPQPLTSIRLRCHVESDFAENREIDIGLFSGSNGIWLEHRTPEVDVVLIPVDNRILTGLTVLPFQSSNLPPTNLVLGPAEPLVVVGYPLNFYDWQNNLPVVRSAALASAFPVPFNGLPMFVTDARLHHGTSGAPVLFISRGFYRTTSANMNIDVGRPMPRILLGIHSGTWPTRLGEESLNLNATWFSSLIGEIVSNPHGGGVTLARR